MAISFFSSDKPRWWGLVQHRIDRGFARSIQAVRRRLNACTPVG